MTRTLGVLLLLGALILGLQYAVRARGGAPPEAAPASKGEPAGQAPSAETAATSPLTEAAPQPLPAFETTPAPLAEMQREVLPVVRVDPEPQVELEIASAADNSPIAGAKVWYRDLEPGETEDLMWKGNELGALEDLLRAKGSEHRSDDQGMVRMTAPKHRGVAIASFGELWGAWWFSKEDPKPYRLLLEPDRDVAVRATESSGAPIGGLSVGLYLQPEDDDRVVADVIQSTGPDGIARLRHAHWHLKYSNPGAWSVRAEALVEPRPVVPIDPTRLPAAPVDLVLPPCASVDVLLLESDGSPRTRRARVWLRDASEPRTSGIYGSGSSGYARRVHGQAHQGRVRFAGVAPGMELEAGSGLDFGSGEDLTVRGHGPSRTGEQVELRIVFGATNPVLVGRLLDAQGLPQIHARFDGELSETYEGGGKHGNSARLETDAEGRFRIDLPPQAGRRTQHVLLVRSRVDRRQSLRLDLELELPAGLTDLGDLQLAETPLLAAGKVVDPAGQPAAFADIVASREEWIGEPAQSVWRRDWKLGAHANHEGTFEIRSWETVPVLRLHAAREGFTEGEPIDLRPGETSIVLRLRSSSAVEGRVLLRPRAKPKEYSIKATRIEQVLPGASVSHSSEDEKEGELDGQGSYRIAGLRPGTYRIELRSTQDFAWEPLYAYDGIQVAEGGLTRVPDMDLNLLLHEFHVEVVDPEGNPIEQGTGTYNALRSGNTCDLTIAHGQVRILTRHPVVEAWFGAQGYQRVEVPELRGDARVVLHPALPVRLRLKSNAVLPPKPYVLCARVGLGGHGWVLAQIGASEWQAFDERGEALVHAPGTGRLWVGYAVCDSAEQRGYEPRGAAEYVDAPDDSGLDVLALPEEQIFEIDVDPEAVRAALAKLQAE